MPKMKCFVFVKSVENLSGSVNYKIGDIVDILPVLPRLGKLDLETHVLIVCDLKIPCANHGFSFEYKGGAKMFKCNECPGNDPDMCDRQLYTRAHWGAPDILEPPEIIYKRRFKIDIKKEIRANILKLAEKIDNTDEEKLLMIKYAKRIENLKTVSCIEDKTEKARK